MKKQFFQQKVDMRSRQKMIDFLQNHYRYNTMNSWNASTSYAHCIKVHRLGLNRKQEDKAFQLIQCEDAYDHLSDYWRCFGEDHDHNYQICFNGRSSGYLVMVRGGWKYSEHKSYCTVCGQRNFQEATKEKNTCGRCGKKTRKNFEHPIKEIFTRPGQNIDMGEDFEDWEFEKIKDRVNLVKEFDKTCDLMRQEFIWMIKHCRIKTEQIAHYETRKRLANCLS